jgi:predicted ATPase
VIRKLIVRNFKKFREVTFEFPGHIILAGPNNAGKTTVLQAIAAWSLALGRWKLTNNFQRHGGTYPWAPLTRQSFSAVPLLSFDLLWYGRGSTNIEVSIEDDAGRSLIMEIKRESTEQIYVRPKPNLAPDEIRAFEMPAVFIPPMTGLSVQEPVLTKPKIDQLMGMGRPGEVLRNLLVQAHEQGETWTKLSGDIRELFNCELLPPDGSGADIVVEYCDLNSSMKLDMASAGSGFLQVLMLLTLMHARPASVLLVDEPDAHLHIILQDAIYRKLRAAAAKSKSQLIISTHSEVIIDAAVPEEIYLIIHEPRRLSNVVDRQRLVESLGALSHTDIMRAIEAKGILYLEDYTDFQILQQWAEKLAHPTAHFFATNPFWQKTVVQHQTGAAGIQAKKHFEYLQLVRPDLPALEILDGDARPEIPETDITGQGYQRVRWRRYEIESYLLHPISLTRFVQNKTGSSSQIHITEMLTYIERNFPPAFMQNPLEDIAFLKATKARTLLLPPILTAAGLSGFPYQSFHEIAAVMLPEEIHPEVKEKLDQIQRALNL